MLIEPFRPEDIPGFLELASEEGWLSDPWEFDFLLSSFPSGCFIARDEKSGTAAGYVTALRHERSGWIGNLIIRPEHRGNGIGETLFLYAVHALNSAGTKTIWLTASVFGKALYEKHGFKRVDTISRWSGSAGWNQTAPDMELGSSVTTSSVIGMDSRAWGDRRDILLEAVAGRGGLLVSEDGFLVVQSCGESLQVGPFAAQECGEAEQLLDSALSTIPRGTKICIDSPNLNQGVVRLFTARGLQITGSNELMFSGVEPAYRPELIYGLATMGSMG